MEYYVHGSQDSLDRDIVYVFDKPPTFQEAKSFCDAETEKENRNIICIENGIVSWCYKGTIDELNNGIYYTYDLHEQDHPLSIERKVERNIVIKHIRVIRGFLSHCSRIPEYRYIVKQGLKSSRFEDKIQALNSIDFSGVEDYNKYSIKEAYKFFAFQLGQILGLYDGLELYTKSDVTDQYPELQKYLYRENASFTHLDKYLRFFIELSLRVVVFYEQETGFSNFPEYKIKIDLKNEEIIKEEN